MESGYGPRLSSRKHRVSFNINIPIMERFVRVHQLLFRGVGFMEHRTVDVLSPKVVPAHVQVVVARGAAPTLPRQSGDVRPPTSVFQVLLLLAISRHYRCIPTSPDSFTKAPSSSLYSFLALSVPGLYSFLPLHDRRPSPPLAHVPNKGRSPLHRLHRLRSP